MSENAAQQGRLAVIDGQPFAPAAARISVYDRGFLYGDSVFETLRTYNGELFALDEHLGRLAESCESTAIPLPVPLSQLGDEAVEAARLAGNDECSLRIMVSRGQGPMGRDPANASVPLRVILVEPLKLPPKAVYADGLSAWCIATVRASDAANSAKLGNYLASALALQEARGHGADEALVVNRDGLVVEGTTSNVFAVRAKNLTTPPLDAGVLGGITRKHILAVAEALQLAVREVALSPAELCQSDEVFLTSSVREVVPIVKVNGQVIGAGRPGATTRALHRGFRELVGLGPTLPWDLA